MQTRAVIHPLVPAEAGTQPLAQNWMPAFAGISATLDQLAAAAAGALPSAGAAAAAARSCAFFFGFAFSGLLRVSRFITPASSRKRATRSVGSAPFAIQAFTLSRSTLRRSLLSFAISGLK